MEYIAQKHKFLCIIFSTKNATSVHSAALEFDIKCQIITPWMMESAAKGLRSLLKLFSSVLEPLLPQGNRTIADLRYGGKDITSPSTLILPPIKS